MDSLPQEIIDEIIDNLPDSSLPSSSLVAKRWQKRSQRRGFHKVWFRSESTMNRWHEQTQGEPSGIRSYVQRARFSDIMEWENPALFGCVLGNFSSLRSLRIYNTEIVDGMLEDISRGGLGGRVTTLDLLGLRCSLPRLVSMILAFPNLQDLSIDCTGVLSREAPAYPVSSQRRPLDSLRVIRCRNRIPETVADLQFAPRLLTLDVQTRSIRTLLVRSSVTIVELSLLGVHLSHVDRETS